MKLRSLVIAGSVGLGTLGLAAAANLVYLARQLRMATDRATAAREDVHNAEELERALRTYNRLALREDPASDGLAKAAAIQGEIITWAAKIARHPDDQREQVLAGDVQRALGVFLEAARRPEPGMERLVHFQMLGEQLAPVEDTLEALISYNEGRLAVTHTELGRENSTAYRVGLSIAVILALGIGIFLWAAGVVMYRPLMRLKSVIDRLAAGDGSVRLPVDGVAEIASTARAFNDLAETQQRQRDAQLHFLASVAHDLRNPLAALAASADLLRDDDLTNGDRAEVTDVLSRQVTYLDRMVGDLLDTTRIEAGRLDLRRELRDLNELCRESAALCRLATTRHKVRLDVPATPVFVEVDALRVGQILNNLLGNAIKYSPAGGEISLTVRQANGRAEVAVRDHGIGIAPGELRGIFEPFRRAASTRESIPGIGLGLSVARRLAQRHDGGLTVTSQVGHGSTFILTLPLAPAADTELERGSYVQAQADRVSAASLGLE